MTHQKEQQQSLNNETIDAYGENVVIQQEDTTTTSSRVGNVINYYSILPQEVLQHALQYVDLCTLSYICSLLHSSHVRKQRWLQSRKTKLTSLFNDPAQNVSLMCVYASLPHLYAMTRVKTAAQMETTTTCPVQESTGDDEQQQQQQHHEGEDVKLVRFIYSVYNNWAVARDRSALSISDFGVLIQHLVTVLDYRLQQKTNTEMKTKSSLRSILPSPRLTVTHLILLVKQLYPYAIRVGKSIASQIITKTTAKSGLSSNMHEVATLLIRPDLMTSKRPISSFGWVIGVYHNLFPSLLHNNSYIFNFTRTIAGAAYATIPSITIGIPDFILGCTLPSDDDIDDGNDASRDEKAISSYDLSPIVIGVSTAFTQYNCFVETLTLDFTVVQIPQSQIAKNRLIYTIGVSIDSLLASISGYSFRLKKLAVYAEHTESVEQSLIQSSIIRLFIDKLALYPTLHLNEIEISGTILTNDEEVTPVSSQLSLLTNVMANVKHLSLIHPRYATSHPSCNTRSGKTPRSVKIATSARKKKTSFHPRATNSLNFIEENEFDEPIVNPFNNRLCELFFTKWVPNTNSVQQCNIEKLNLYDITDPKFCAIASHSTSLRKLKIYFDNGWQYVEMERIAEIRKAMNNNKSIIHVTIDTTFGNFKTSIFQIQSPNQVTYEEEEKPTDEGALNVDDCTGFSFFKCIACLPNLKHVTVEIPFYKMAGLFNPQILSSMFENLQLRDQKLERLKIRETEQLQNICNQRFADHLFIVLISYMDDLITDRVSFKIYSSVLFQMICQAFVLRRETEHGWQYQLIHLGVTQPTGTKDFIFKFILRYVKSKKAGNKTLEGASPLIRDGYLNGSSSENKKQMGYNFPLLELSYCCKGISLPDLLVDEEVERVLVNVGNLARCQLNTELIKQHLFILNISPSMKLNAKTLRRCVHRQRRFSK